MRAPWHEMYIHVVWSTWNRLPLITSELIPHIHRILAAKCNALDCPPLAIGGVEDHIHVFARFTPTVAVSSLVKEMKGSSSHAITHVIRPGEFFKWQGGYGAFSVSRRHVEMISAYVLNQVSHHKAGTVYSPLERYGEEGLSD